MFFSTEARVGFWLTLFAGLLLAAWLFGWNPLELLSGLTHIKG